MYKVIRPRFMVLVGVMTEDTCVGTATTNIKYEPGCKVKVISITKFKQ